MTTPAKTPVEIRYGEKLTDSEVVQYARDCLSTSEEWFSTIWKEGSDLYEMYWGETLTDRDRQYLVDTQRPIISFNYACSTINAIVGSDQADRKEAIFRGSGNEDEDDFKAECQTQLVRKYMNDCNGRRKESDAFQDMLIVGYGFSEVFLDVSKGSPAPVLVRVQPWEMYPDPDASDDNLEDARYFCRKKAWYLEEVQSRWPDKADELERGIGQKQIPQLAPKPSVEGNWTRSAVPQRRGRIEIMDFQYKRYMPRVLWTDPETGESKETDRDELDERKEELKLQAEAERQAKLDQMHQQMMSGGGMMGGAGMSDGMGGGMTGPEIMGQGGGGMMAQGGMPPGGMGPEMTGQGGGMMGENMPMQHTPEMDAMLAMAEEQVPLNVPEIEAFAFAKETFWRAHVALGNKGGILLDHKEQDVPKFSYNAVTGYKRKVLNEGRVRFFGPARILHDPQLYINKAASVYLEILARGSKGGWFIGESAVIGDPQKFIKKLSIPGGSDIVRDEALTNSLIQAKPTVQTPTGFENYIRTLIDHLGNTTGVTEWLKGTAQSERSNVLITNLQGQSMVLLNPLFDPLQQFRIRNATLMAALAIRHGRDEDLTRILGKIGQARGITLQEYLNPQTGKNEWIPMMDEMTGEPITAVSILREVDPFKYDVVVDVGSASPTLKQATWQLFAQQGFFKDLMEAGVPPDVLVPPIIRNMPIPGVMPQAIGDEVEQRMKAQLQIQTQEGILMALQQMDPEMMMQTLQQAAQMAQQVMGQGQEGQPPQGGQEQEMMNG